MISRRLPQAVGHEGDLALLVVVDAVVIDAAVAPGANATGILIVAVVGEVER